jgi:uncharacterized protein YyaL (SSP411 family)
MNKFSNRLSHETSPYLLQHAHNPVDWYPWGEEALTRARDEDKPILVSIGYAACHWCHVMERESFENEETAALMNEHFINIKIDREERPDLDHIYMDAVQAMTGSGGWPLNVFLTPDARPFYGGTYFPPRRAFNRASWTETLTAIIGAFRGKRSELETQAENLIQHLVDANSFGFNDAGKTDGFFSKKKVDEAVDNMMKNADTEWGGFGRAPKFPQTFSIQFLLRYDYVANRNKTSEVPGHDKTGSAELTQALLSLDKMIAGGIYDQVGGGFARYSTDTEWLAPHFEKMLYDNALLISVLSEAYQLTKRRRYLEVINETMEFITREMMHEDGGFYAALDADSEGEEGKFYVWQKNEVESILGDKAALFCSYYDITEEGNWEHKNILRVKRDLSSFAGEHQLDADALHDELNEGCRKLLMERAKRRRPLLDDKIILGWNALMNTACSKAYTATGNKSFRDMSIANMRFLLDRFKSREEIALHHTWKNGEARFPGFLDDYAFTIQALIHLQEITGDHDWLRKAGELAAFVIREFSEEGTGFFYYTRAGQKDVIIRKKEVYDGAVPSGNAMMASNLYRLGILLDQPEWKDRSYTMVNSLLNATTRHPSSFGCWAGLLLEMNSGTTEIAILGINADKIRDELLMHYIPHRVLMSSTIENEDFALLAKKPVMQKTAIYICENFECKAPVHDINAVLSLINSA